MTETATPAADIDYAGWRQRIRTDALSNYHYCMALGILRESNRSAAIEHLRRAIAIDTGMRPAYFELIDLLRAEGKTAEADDVEQQAQAVCPGYAMEGFLQRGIELTRIDRTSGLALLLQAADRFPEIRSRAFAEVGDLHHARALELQASGDQSGYLEAMKTAETYAPGNVRRLFQLHAFHRDRNELQAATDYAFKVLELAEPAERSRYVMAVVSLLCMRLHLDEAAKVLGETLAIQPTWVLPKVILGQVLIALGRFDEAKAMSRAALDLEPGSIDAMTKLGEVLWATGDAQGSVELFTRCLELNEGTHRAMSDLALTLAEAGQHDRAVPMARSAAIASGNINWHLTNLGLVLDAAGLADEAARVFQRAATEHSRLSNPRSLWYQAKLRPRYEEALTARFERLGVARPE